MRQKVMSDGLKKGVVTFVLQLSKLLIIFEGLT